MNRAVFMTALEQRLKSPVRMVLSGMLLFFPLLGAWLAPITGLASFGNGFNFGVILAAGMIGQDVSAGVLQLMFARPVRRWEYVLSRWLAFAVAAVALVAIQVAVGWLILSVRGMPPDTQEVLFLGAAQALAGIGAVSVFTLFSSLIGGLGDLAIYLMVMVTGTVLQLGGQIAGKAWLVRVAEEIGRFISPALDVAQVFNAPSPPWFAIFSYLSTVAVCLALAVVMVNRKELSYASS